MKWITRERPKIDRIACPWHHEMLRQGMVICDALYAWCRHLVNEAHDCKPA